MFYNIVAPANIPINGFVGIAGFVGIVGFTIIAVLLILRLANQMKNKKNHTILFKFFSLYQFLKNSENEIKY